MPPHTHYIYARTQIYIYTCTLRLYAYILIQLCLHLHRYALLYLGTEELKVFVVEKRTEKSDKIILRELFDSFEQGDRTASQLFPKHGLVAEALLI